MRVEIQVRAHLLVVDGSADAELPQSGGPPLVVGPEAWFVGGRVDVDAPTNVCITDEPEVAGALVERHAGFLPTPDRVLRISGVDGIVLLEAPVPSDTTTLRLFTDDPVEPDRVVLVLDTSAGGTTA